MYLYVGALNISSHNNESLIQSLHSFGSGVSVRAKKKFFRLARLIPMIRQQIDREMVKIADGMERTIAERTSNMKYFVALPTDGVGKEEILKLIDDYLNLGVYKWKEGRVSGAVYNFNPELCDLVAAVYGKTSYTNPLHSDIFPGINKMEAEVVRMCATMFNGGLETVGTVNT